MSYQVLARKLRPATFGELVGQEHVVRALTHALDTGRVHHAYLFTGTRGVGKTTIARILAKSLNCELGVSSTPCDDCSICREVKENRFVDLIEVDAASRTGVDDTRDLLDNAQYLPSRGRYKVYLIDEVHMLSAASFNALLKTLEEPPEHVKFLLATTDPKKVPVTVLSRCLQFQLKNLSREPIAGYLAQVLTDEGIEFDQGALDVIGRSAAGSMRDALSLTDQAIAYGQGAVKQADVVQMLGAVARDEVDALLRALHQGSTADLMSHSRELAERNADFEDVLSNLLEAFHGLAVDAALQVAQRNEPQEDSYGFSPEELQLYYQIALLGHRDLALAPEPRTGFEMTLLRMLAFSPRESSVPARKPAAPDDAPQVPPSSAPQTEPEKVQANQASALALEVDQPPKTQDAADTEPVSIDAPGAISDSGADRERAGLWRDLVDRLAIGGVAKMIADHSVLLDHADGTYHVLLDTDHDTLLSDAQAHALERALQALGESEDRLLIEVGQPSWETPAQIRQRESLERQTQAEQAIEADATVKDLLSEFDAQIQQVRPI